MLSKIIYVSTRVTTDQAAQKIEDDNIQSVSERNNRKNDVTGILVSTNRHYIQILEGHDEVIHPLFDTIKNDIRHKKVQLKADRAIKMRVFRGWAMNIININSMSSVLYGYKFEGLDLDPYALTYSAVSELILRSARRDY